VTDPFSPAGVSGNWHMNAVLSRHMDDGDLGMGFITAGEALVQHWKEHGANDGLFVPIVLNFRHGLELLLKCAIRDAARSLRASGDSDSSLVPTKLDNWLLRKAGHSLQSLAIRLDEYLGRLDLEQLPADTHSVLLSIHNLDPRGDTFRYVTTWDKGTRSYQPTPRPKAEHVDVGEMAKQFSEVGTLIGFGVLTVLEQHREMLAEWGP